MILKSSDLLKTIRTKAALTSGQVGFTDDEMLRMATAILQSDIMALVKSSFEGYFLVTERIALVAGQDRYRLPVRAPVMSLNYIYAEDSNGRPSDLAKLTIGEITQFNPTVTTSSPSAFFIEGNYIRVFPTPNNTPDGNLVISYHFKPNALVLETQGRTIAAITGNQITLPSVPTGWDTTMKVDIINHLQGNEIFQYSTAITSIVGNVITLAEVSPDVTVGNYISLEGTAFVPMVPEEFHELLAEMTVEKIAKVRNDQVRIQQSQDSIKRINMNLVSMMDTRVDNKPDVVRSRNPFLPGNQRGRYR